MPRPTTSFRQVFFAGMVLLALVSMGLWGAIWIYGDYRAFKTDSQELRDKYLEAQEDLLRNEVANVASYIHYMMEQTEIRLKVSIRERVEEACNIAMNLYLQNRDNKSPAEIQKLIKDSLRPIRFNKGRGYFFAFNMNGVEELFADRPEMEGKNMLGVTGARGELVVRDMLNLVRAQNEGFYEYTWTKPHAEKQDNPKIAFVKLFEPYGWVFGTGEYLDDVRNEIQDEVLDYISGSRFGTEGYFFGSTFQGEPLFSNGKITKGTGNIWELTDPYGFKIIQEQKKAAEQPQGGFVRYSWPKLESLAPMPKLSFVLGVPIWEWTIGAGVYLDTIELEMAHRGEILKDNLVTKIQRSLLILLALLILILLWVRFLSNRLQSEINTFSMFFEKAATQFITIDPNELHFLEFQRLAHLANSMACDRKRAEDALRESEYRAKAMFQAIPDLIFRMDSQGVFLDYKADISDLYVQSEPTIIGKRNRDLTPPEFSDLVDRQIRTTLETGTPQTFEYQLPIPVRGVRDYEARMVASGVDEVTTIVRDVTEHKRAEAERLRLEERLRRSEKMEALGTLAGGVAHDLNNVLGIIVGYSELLLDGLDDSSSKRTQALEIHRGGQRAAAIVQDLLTLARRGVSARKVLNLNNIVMGCKKSPEFAMVLSTHPGIEIKTDFETDLLNVLGSPVHLEKSFINLVANAAEAMPNGGALAVKTANCYLDKPISGYDEVREGDYVVLSVTDTGEGIEASDLKRIFEPFYTKKVMGRSGTGLGLAVVWGTIKDHLGYINVESQEGKGTTFTLYFPVTRDEITPEHVAISAYEYMGNGESILVVDDVKEQRELASTMIRKLNYIVESVSSGEEAVEYIRNHAVDLVVLDMIMDPGIDGLDTYRKMLDIHPHQKAIIVSGFAETERVREAQSLGAGTYVKKPYVLEKLGLAVKKELERQG